MCELHPHDSLNHLDGAFLLGFLWPIIMICLVHSPYLAYLRILLCVCIGGSYLGILVNREWIPNCFTLGILICLLPQTHLLTGFPPAFPEQVALSLCVWLSLPFHVSTLCVLLTSAWDWTPWMSWGRLPSRPAEAWAQGDEGQLQASSLGRQCQGDFDGWLWRIPYSLFRCNQHRCAIIWRDWKGREWGHDSVRHALFSYLVI